MKVNKNFVFALVGTLVTSIPLAFFWQSFEPLYAIPIFFAWLPYKIGENHYSLFGGFSENSIYSLFGIMQSAGYDAKQLTGISLYQSAKGDAWQLFSISFYQTAGDETMQFFGINIYQTAKNNAAQLFGVNLYQTAGNDTTQVVGISIYQAAGNDADQYIGISLYRAAGNNTMQEFGISVYQLYVSEVENRYSLFILSHKTKKHLPNFR